MEAPRATSLRLHLPRRASAASPSCSRTTWTCSCCRPGRAARGRLRRNSTAASRSRRLVYEGHDYYLLLCPALLLLLCAAFQCDAHSRVLGWLARRSGKPRIAAFASAPRRSPTTRSRRAGARRRARDARGAAAAQRTREAAADAARRNMRRGVGVNAAWRSTLAQARGGPRPAASAAGSLRLRAAGLLAKLTPNPNKCTVSGV